MRRDLEVLFLSMDFSSVNSSQFVVKELCDLEACLLYFNFMFFFLPECDFYVCGLEIFVINPRILSIRIGQFVLGWANPNAPCRKGAGLLCETHPGDTVVIHDPEVFILSIDFFSVNSLLFTAMELWNLAAGLLCIKISFFPLSVCLMLGNFCNKSPHSGKLTGMSKSWCSM